MVYHIASNHSSFFVCDVARSAAQPTNNKRNRANCPNDQVFIHQTSTSNYAYIWTTCTDTKEDGISESKNMIKPIHWLSNG